SASTRFHTAARVRLYSRARSPPGTGPLARRSSSAFSTASVSLGAVAGAWADIPGLSHLSAPAPPRLRARTRALYDHGDTGHRTGTRHVRPRHPCHLPAVPDLPGRGS